MIDVQFAMEPTLFRLPFGSPSRVCGHSLRRPPFVAFDHLFRQSLTKLRCILEDSTPREFAFVTFAGIAVIAVVERATSDGANGFEEFYPHYLPTLSRAAQPSLLLGRRTTQVSRKSTLISWCTKPSSLSQDRSSRNATRLATAISPLPCLV